MSNKAPANDHGALLKQALRALEQMKRKLAVAESKASQPIAIIGMGCRFPGDISDPETFWEMLQSGREAISEVPADRWNIDRFYHPDPSHPGTMVSRFGGFLNDVDLFDATFFGIAPREAAMMDPQQRLLLEVSWETLERAAIAPRSLAGSRTGVYLGVTSGDYAQLQLRQADPGLLDVHYASGNAHSIASGRLSYLLGLKGPSLSIDTACSSSLVAIHLACQALRSGECTMALAGGVNLILAPETTIALSHAHMMSPDGRSKAFDDRADGFARAEGCGVVLLKPLAQALTDGDAILAVIRGSALNQDGASSSLTAPHGPSQEELMRRALQDAGFHPSDVSYVETHGTGTTLGDPIELQALGAVYGSVRAGDRPLAIGSLKTNFGHMEAAAGVGGLIKLVLSLQHGQIPPHLQFRTPTRHVRWDRLNLEVPTSLLNWPASSTTLSNNATRVGAVSSFGFSGTNAHLIVEQAPAGAPIDSAETDGNVNVGEARRVAFLPLSASSDEALQALVTSYGAWLESDRSAAYSWQDIAATASRSRDHLRYRLAIHAASKQEAARMLRLVRPSKRSLTPSRSICFLCTGQGSEYQGMGLHLLETSPVFRKAVERLETASEGVLGTSIPAIWASSHDELSRASLTQPALFAYGWALSELWQSWGVRPDVVFGHSLGEYIAATIAGALTPEDAIRLVAARGRFTEELAVAGGMTVLPSAPEEVEELLARMPADMRLDIAAVNGPTSTVVSGPIKAIELLESVLAARGQGYKRLRTTHGFHSSAIEAMLDPFSAMTERFTYQRPLVPWISNVTGEVMDPQQPLSARYWSRHLRETVQFARGLRTAQAMGSHLYIEIGAQPQLLALADCNGTPAGACIASERPGRKLNESTSIFHAAERLYMAGVDLDWKAMTEAWPFRRVPLPTYPFQRKRFWFTDKQTNAHTRSQPLPSQTAAASVHPLLGARLRTRSVAATFQCELDIRSHTSLADHVVMGERILPGAAYLEMAAAAVNLMEPDGAFRIANAEFRASCIFDQPRLVETTLSSVDAATGSRTFEIASTSLGRPSEAIPCSAEWVLHAVGTVDKRSPEDLNANSVNLAGVKSRAETCWDKDAFYGRFEQSGLKFGPMFRTVQQAWGTPDEGLVELLLQPAVVAEFALYSVHPILLDACIQAAAAISGGISQRPYLPAALRRFELAGDPASLCYAHAEVVTRSTTSHTVNIVGLDREGKILLTAEGLTLIQPAEKAYQGWLHTVLWKEVAFDRAISPEVRKSAQSAIGVDRPSQQDVSTEGEDMQWKALERFDSWMIEFDELCAAWLAKVVTQAGMNLETGGGFTRPEFLSVLRVIPVQERLAFRFLETLCTFNYLRALPGQRYEVLGKVLPDLEQRSTQLRLGNHPEMQWAEHCLPSLLSMLRGETHPVEALFDEGGRSIAKRLYRESVSARYFNAEVARLAASAALQHNGRSRVLEVGGGTAATTSYLVPALKGSIAEYVFTDVGAGFVKEAKYEFRDVPNMRFETLDLEKSPQTQGFSDRSFDIIVASNVLHATSNLSATLSRLSSLLSEEGVLLIAETLDGQPWIDMTVGFTPGWWSFSDADLRSSYPLIGKQAWLDLLRRCDFEIVSTFPGSEHGFLKNQCLFSVKHQTALRLNPDERLGADHHVLVLKPGDAGAALPFADLLVMAATRSGAYTRLESLDGDPGAALEQWLACASTGAASTRDRRSIYFLAIDPPIPGTSHFLAWQQTMMDSALAWSQALDACGLLNTCRLWFVSRGAFGPQVLSAGPAGFPAFVRSLRAEYAGVQAFAVDVAQENDVESEAAAAWQLWEASQSAAPDQIQLAYRKSRWWSPRLHPYYLPKSTGSVEVQEITARRVQLPTTGSLEDIALVSVTRRPPEREEVAIEIRAAAVNFHEVLSALQSDRRHLVAPGGECSGVVISVGSGVVDLKPGDEVLVIGSGLLSDFATVSRDRVWLKPPRLSLEQAATLPIPFLTARWCLDKVANLQRGERVLIHAGAGGVGLAAIQEARRLGAIVYATAGSESKRAFLRDNGVEAVFDSRTSTFESETLLATGFQGVNVILNSLNGALIAASLRTLAPRGRFIELGEDTGWDETRVRSLRPDVQYHRVHLRSDLETVTPAIRKALDAVVNDAANGVIEPLPHRMFPPEEATEAFRFMAAGKHTGRVLIGSSKQPAKTDHRISSDGAYLVTGGLSGLGLLTVEWLARQGAGCILAVGRRPADRATDIKLDSLRSLGVAVLIKRCDVGRREEVAAAIDSIPATFSLRGVFHAAGVLDDASIPQQTPEKFKNVMDVKVAGAWHLHDLTLALKLDWFVMFSSAAGLLGGRGQSNHAVANAALDALSHYRKERLGLTALSVNWGAWSGSGAAVRHSALERSERLGAAPIPSQVGLEIMGRLLMTDTTQVLVSQVDWQKWIASSPASAAANADLLMDILDRQHDAAPPSAPEAVPSKSTGITSLSLKNILKSAPPLQQYALLGSSLESRVRTVLSMTGNEVIDPFRPLQEYGLDSLLSIEFRNVLCTDLEIRLPSTTMFDYPTLASLTDWLFHDVLKLQINFHMDQEKTTTKGDLLDEVATMSEGDVERLFQQKLAGTRL